MSEIEKMYENCNFEKSMGVGSPLALHPFTAEKQLLLLQWICKKFQEIYISHTDFKEFQSWEIVYKISVHSNCFEECLCAFINLFWQSLTEEEKQQVKGILE